MKPLFAATPPGWLLSRSANLRDDLTDLAATWPLQTIAVLVAVERWHKPLMEQAVAAAREAGISWAEIGSALGVTRQSAHQRFSTAQTRQSSQ